MARVTDVLADRAGAVLTVNADASVLEAIQRMVEHNVGSLVVFEEGRVAGIFTERDVLRRVAMHEHPMRLTAVRSVMTKDPVTVELESSVQECMMLMTQRRIRHLPVLQAGALVGVISIGDLVKHMAEERAHEVRQLTQYITGQLA